MIAGESKKERKEKEKREKERDLACIKGTPERKTVHSKYKQHSPI